MRIYAFTSFYPSLYKPYYDAHFADLVARGHDLVILASGSQGSIVSEKARQNGLVERTRYYISDEIRQVAWRAPELVASLVRGGRGAVRVAGAAASEVRGLRNRVKAAARALLLPLEPPDLCVVHSHETWRLLPWLHRLYPACPVSLYYYGGLPPEAGGGASRARALGSLRGVDAIFTCSAYAGREAVEQGADPDRVHVLPLAFDLEDFRLPVPRTYRSGGKLRLMSVGRLSWGKGHQDALDALQILLRGAPTPEVEYAIVGGGVLGEELESYAGALGLGEVVTFTGALDNQAVRTMYGQVDALVLPSFSTPGWTETQGTVIQEAMLMEALVVTTRTGGVPESIPPWMEAFQVPERDPRALADALRRVAALDPREMARLGTMNREWTLERFDVADFNRSLVETSLRAASGS